MLENSYICKWCKKDLKDDEIPPTAKPYYDNFTHFTKAIELINTGWECVECNCRWTYSGELIKEGIEDLKDKYKIEDINEGIKEISDDNSESNESNNESEDISDGQENN